jgi:hypothetical protein
MRAKTLIRRASGLRVRLASAVHVAAFINKECAMSFIKDAAVTFAVTFAVGSPFLGVAGCVGDAPPDPIDIAVGDPVGSGPADPGSPGTPAAVSKPVSLENLNGDLTILGTANAKISGTLTPFAHANDGNDAAHAADIQAAIDDVKTTIRVDLTATPARIYCGQAQSDHGAVSRYSTGCNIDLNLPQQNAQLNALTHNGDVFLDDAGGTFTLSSSNGAITGTRLNGAITVDTSNGEVKLQIAPSKGATIDARSSNGGIELALPATFAADRIELSTSNGELLSTFPIVNYQGYGAAGTGAALVRIDTSNGDVSLVRR